MRQCASTTCTIDGLTNDVEYTFTVAAQNAVDWSEPSPPSAHGAPGRRPGRARRARRSSSATARSARRWTAPTSAGLADHRLHARDLARAAERARRRSRPRRPATRSRGLTNGTAYSVRVRAHNQAPDPSGWSPSSPPMVPAGVPRRARGRRRRRPTRPLGRVIVITWAAPVGQRRRGRGVRGRRRRARRLARAWSPPARSTLTFDARADQVPVPVSRAGPEQGGLGRGRAPPRRRRSGCRPRRRRSPPTAVPGGRPDRPALVRRRRQRHPDPVLRRPAARRRRARRGQPVVVHVREPAPAGRATRTRCARCNGAGSSGWSGPRRRRPRRRPVAAASGRGDRQRHRRPPDRDHGHPERRRRRGRRGPRVHLGAPERPRRPARRGRSPAATAAVDVSGWRLPFRGSRVTATVTAETSIGASTGVGGADVAWGQAPAR